VGEFGAEDPDVTIRYFAPITEEEREEVRDSDDDYRTEEDENQMELLEDSSEDEEDVLEDRLESLDKAFNSAFQRGHAYGLLDRDSSSEDDMEQ